MSSPVRQSCWPWAREKTIPQDTALVASPAREDLGQLKATEAFRREFESKDGPIPKTVPLRKNPHTGQMEIGVNHGSGLVWKPMVNG